jgi:hypothetical protein
MNDYKEDIARGYAKQKARFYADPRFAGMAGLAIGVVGTLLFQWIF